MWCIKHELGFVDRNIIVLQMTHTHATKSKIKVSLALFHSHSHAVSDFVAQQTGHTARCHTVQLTLAG